MYTNYFRLKEPPFSLTPDPRYLYMSERHREGLAHLLYGVQQPGGFIQLTGEIGCGKTTLCRCLVSQLPPETDIALILNPRLTVVELLAAFCDELRIQYPSGTDSIKVLVDALNRYLLEAHARNRRTVLIIDEAQNLHRDVLEQIRLLTNLETEQEKLLQIILIGQPELSTLLDHPSLRQLAQRITARYHLLPLSLQDTLAYIQHRLFIAGLSQPVFTTSALHETYRLTKGVPRLINILCDRALLGAYAYDKQRVGKSIVRKAAKEISAAKHSPVHRRWVYASVIASALVLLLALAYAFGPLGNNRTGWNFFGIRKQETVSTPQHGISATDSPGAGIGTSGVAEAVVPLRAPGGRLAGQDSGIPDRNATAAGIPSGKPAVEPVPTHSLEGLLRSPLLQSTLTSSFNSLYAAWGIPIQIRPSEMGCTASRAYGFQCLFLPGNWLKIRRLDIPAILGFELPNGDKRHGTLVGLQGNTATLTIDGQDYVFPVQEVDRWWDGSLILIWKPPFDTLILPMGMQGEEIIWVRRTLDACEGKPVQASPSDLFDESLRQRILVFQKTQRLVEDGRIGPETLVRLAIMDDPSGVPTLSGHGDAGGTL